MSSITMYRNNGLGPNFFQANTPLKHEICRQGLANYVTVPRLAKSITFVTSQVETPQCFDIKSTGRLGEVGRSFDHDLYRWLQRAYNRGDRFMKVEYTE